MFESYLLDGTDTLQYDSLKYESNISGFIAGYNTDKILIPGNHKITCTVYLNNKSYLSSVSLTVKNVITVDTLYYDKNLEIYQFPGAYIYTISLDNDDSPIIGSSNRGLFYKNNGIWENNNKSDGLYINDLQSIGVDKNNTIYVGYGYVEGISKKLGQGWEYIPMDKSFGGDVHVIRFDENNVLWTANHTGDITKYINGYWYHYTGLPANYHHPDELLFDKEKVLWSTSTYGSICFDGQTWKSVKVNGAIINASSMAIDKYDNKWFGSFSPNEVIKISKTDTVIYTPQNSSLPMASTWAIAIDQNGITYIGNDYGLFKLNGQNWVEVTLPSLANKEIRNIKIDSKNNIWFSSPTYFGCIKQ